MIKAKKSLGQNFLVDDSVSREIVETVAPSPSDIIIEIGPGKGAITKRLLARCGYLTAIEIDALLIKKLGQEITNPKFNLIAADALKLNWQTEIQDSLVRWRKVNPHINQEPRVRVVANLPYYISTPIVERLMKLDNQISDMTLMLQEEVVNRIVSVPNTRDYGYLSVLVQYYRNARKLFRVPPTAFQPVPRVWSAILQLTNRSEPRVMVSDETRFFALVRSAFAQRRKTLMNNLKAASETLQFKEEIYSAIAKSRIDANRRAETLSLEEFAELYHALFSE